MSNFIIEPVCPECGGDIIYRGYEYHVVHPAYYLDPESIEIDYFKYECRECGKELKSVKEL